MARIIAICGKICSGKTYYANQIKDKEKAVILSCDELTKVLFDNDLGDKHDEMALRIWDYFKIKSVDLVKVGCNVILDWGFWSKENRKSLTEFYELQNIPCEWHYIDVDDKTWHRNIEKRNQKVLAGEDTCDYYLDEGLMEKLLSKWEEPSKEEIDVWYVLDSLQTTIDRISRMEHNFDEVSKGLKNNPESIKDGYVQKVLNELKAYYDSGQWLKDYEADERGELPKDMKRGVLSQDGLYDLLCEIDGMRK